VRRSKKSRVGGPSPAGPGVAWVCNYDFRRRELNHFCPKCEKHTTYHASDTSGTKIGDNRGLSRIARRGEKNNISKTVHAGQRNAGKDRRGEEVADPQLGT
jgi:hypothetical protein